MWEGLSALPAQSARPLSCVCHCALAVGFWPPGPGRTRAGPHGAGASPAQGALGSASRCKVGREPWHWNSFCSLCRTSGCLSTSTTPVTTPHTCHLAPSSSPRGGGPPCCPSFSPGMKGEGRLAPAPFLAQSHGAISQMGKWRRMEKQELAGLVVNEGVPGYVFALVLGPGWGWAGNRYVTLRLPAVGLLRVCGPCRRG